MFTGIIEHQGSIKEADSSGLVIKAKAALVEQLTVGASIAVNGVCLTVRRIISPTTFAIDMMPETLRVTTMGRLAPGDVINLEPALSANGLLGGHILQGHIDGTATITAIKPVKDDHIIELTTTKQLLKYLVDKGSVSIDGISLTLIKVSDDGFSVGIIPHTWQHTTLNHAQVGDLVNLEVDVLAKYVYKFTRSQKGLHNEKS